MNSNWLLVEIVPDLAAARTTRTGVFAQIKQCAGVVCVIDVSSVARETLDQWLLPADQVWEYQEALKRRRRKLQPELPLGGKEPRSRRGQRAVGT